MYYLRFLFLTCAFFAGIGTTVIAQEFAPEAGEATEYTPHVDTTLTQHWTSIYGYSFDFPAEFKFNKLGSRVNEAGQTEQANYIIPGGKGSVIIQYFKEERMVPKGYALLDSIHFYDIDSAGRNGMIYRRVYILRENTVQIDILLTDKGEALYADRVRAIFDTFTPSEAMVKELQGWRYGRDPKEYQEGRYPAGGGPNRK